MVTVAGSKVRARRRTPAPSACRNSSIAEKRIPRSGSGFKLEPAPDLIGRSCWRQVALVQPELHNHEGRKLLTSRNLCRQRAELACPVLPLAAGQGNMRTKRPRLSIESAPRGSLYHSLLQHRQFRTDFHPGIKDAHTLKHAHAVQPHRNRRAQYPAQLRNQALVLLFAGAAQKLQRDVPRIRHRPAKIGCRAKPIHEPGQFCPHRISQRYSHKQPHRDSVGQTQDQVQDQMQDQGFPVYA